MGLCHQSKTTSRMASVTQGNSLCFVPREVRDKLTREICVFLFATKLQRSLGRPGSAQVALLGGHGTQAEAAHRVPLALGLQGEESRLGLDRRLAALGSPASQSTAGPHPSRVHFPFWSQLVPRELRGARSWSVFSLRLRGTGQEDSPGNRVEQGLGLVPVCGV